LNWHQVCPTEGKKKNLAKKKESKERRRKKGKRRKKEMELDCRLRICTSDHCRRLTASKSG